MKELFSTTPQENSSISKTADIPFFADQTSVVLRNRGLINSESIDEYIARGGYEALTKALTSMTAEQVLQEMKGSGLRSRGSGGFPTGILWETCRNISSDKHYVICTVDEGDPGSFIGRSIVESDPHAMIEGMLIGAYAIGSGEGYICIRSDFPVALDRIQKAIGQAREHGFVGANILGKGFNFDITILLSKASLVCGESSVLIASIEGRPAEPRAKYVHIVEKGLWDKPTCLDNVETWANVPQIILRGAQWFAGIGAVDAGGIQRQGSKGTKVFSLLGNVSNTGLVEVPMGTTLRKIIFTVGGGMKNGNQFKAAHIGGPSGGFVPESVLDTPVDYEELTNLGSMMGSGSIVVVDEDHCIVDLTRRCLAFLQTETCGKCVPCREGTKRILDILEKIAGGEGTEEDLSLLEELSTVIAESSLCGVGGSAPNPVLTSLKYFRDEYEMHVKNNTCPAHVCRPSVPEMVDR